MLSLVLNSISSAELKMMEQEHQSLVHEGVHLVLLEVREEQMLQIVEVLKTSFLNILLIVGY